MGLISAGTTIFDAGSVNAGGAMTFIKKITASSSSTISFVHGSNSVVFDGTYKEYLFTFNNLHPAANACDFMFQVSTNSGSSYGVSMTSCYAQTYHKEDGGGGNVAHRTGSVNSLGNSTSFQSMSTADGIGNDNDQCGSGYLRFFNPADTTHVKNWMIDFTHYTQDTGSMRNFRSGNVNSTSAINAFQFKMNNGSADQNTDKGDICLYGIS